MDAIELEHVTKRFGDFIAVHDLSLRVPSGSIYGFIGPNGSGKTTTLRMIMRILHPNEGWIRVLGEDVRAKAAATDRVGYLPEERGLYKKMKVREVLRYYAELKSAANARQAVESWLSRMGLSEWADKKVESLSKGMSQKVQFIAAVVAQPQLVILDEPFSGLDPVNADAIRESVLELGREGTTIVFSTHDMGTAEKMCDYIFMIFKGRKVLDGTLNEIQGWYGTDSLRIEIERDDGGGKHEGWGGVDGGGVGLGSALQSLPGVEKVVDFGRRQELRLGRGADAQAILSKLVGLGRVRYFEVGHPSLHDIFVRIAGPEAAEVRDA